MRTEKITDGYYRAYDAETDLTGFGNTPEEAAQDVKKQAKAGATARPARRKRPLEPPAEEQLSSLDRRYLPVVDKLLKKHGLKRPEGARRWDYVPAMLAKLIAAMRELPAQAMEEAPEPKKERALNVTGISGGKVQTEIIEVEQPQYRPVKKEPRSPIPSLRKARTHLAKLLEYAERPPAHKERIKTRCASLREALSSSALAVLDLGLEAPKGSERFGYAKTGLLRLLDALDSDRPLESHRLSDAERREVEAQPEKVLADHQKLVDALDAGNVTDGESWQAEYERLLAEYSKLSETLEDDWEGASELREWLDRIERILARNENWRQGQPRPLTRRVIKSGCIAWSAGGRGPEYHHISKGRDKLTGPLPDFLRDLISCCNGTHEWERKPPSHVPEGYHWPERAKRGDRLSASETAIHQAIVEHFGI
jgi:hypothetical protein